jgi:hypothetical protein
MLSTQTKQRGFIFCFAFFLFISVAYPFIVDDSYSFLEGDAINVANFSIKQLYAEKFRRDPYISNLHTFYTPTHLFLVKFILSKTRSFIKTYQIILVIQIFFTLSFTFLMLQALFPETKYFTLTVISLLFVFVFIKMPLERIGFSGIRTAWSRSSMAVFTPLLFLYYIKGTDLKLKQFVLPKMLLLAIFLGLGVNIHPPTAIFLFMLFFIHWIFTTEMSRNNWILAFALVFCFGVGAYVYISVFPSRNPMVLFIYALNHFSKIWDTVCLKACLIFSGNHIYEVWWLWQLLYPPYVITALILLFSFQIELDALKSPILFKALRGLFLVGFVLVVLGSCISYFLPLFHLYVYPCQRGGRVLFFIFELLCAYCFLSCQHLFEKKSRYYLLICAILFFFLFSSEATGMIFIPVKRPSFAFLNLVLRILPVLFLLCLYFARKLGKISTMRFKNFIYFTSVVLLVFWPLASNGMKSAIGNFLDSTYHLGGWKTLQSFGLSNNQYLHDQFDSMVDWINSNTPEDAFFLYAIPEPRSLCVRIATLRPGIGGNKFLLGNKTIKKYDAIVTDYFEASSSGSSKSFMRLLKDENINYLLVADKKRCEKLRQIGFGKIVFQNGIYTIFRVDFAQ